MINSNVDHIEYNDHVNNLEHFSLAARLCRSMQLPIVVPPKFLVKLRSVPLFTANAKGNERDDHSKSNYHHARRGTQRKVFPGTYRW